MSNEVAKEIDELRKRIRIIEDNKKAYADESNALLKRQANLIDKLKEDNRGLCKSMVAKNKSKKEVTQAKKAMTEAHTEMITIK